MSTATAKHTEQAELAADKIIDDALHYLDDALHYHRGPELLRWRAFLTDLSPSQLRNVTAIEREHKRAFGRVAELAREELARRGEQP